MKQLIVLKALPFFPFISCFGIHVNIFFSLFDGLSCYILVGSILSFVSFKQKDRCKYYKLSGKTLLEKV